MKNDFELVKFIDNDFSLDVMFDKDNNTVWLNKNDISILYERDRSVISKHIKNILSNEENLESNVQKMHVANSDKPITFYSANIIINIGYRIKSNRVYVFKEWFETLVNENKEDSKNDNK